MKKLLILALFLGFSCTSQKEESNPLIVTDAEEILIAYPNYDRYIVTFDDRTTMTVGEMMYMVDEYRDLLDTLNENPYEE